MKRILALLLCLLACFSLFFVAPGTTAYAAEDETAVVNNPNSKDRLNLRSDSSAESTSLGKYYNGVKVLIVGYTSDTWAMVNIEGTLGYMMKKYLAYGSAGDSVASAIPTVKVNNPNPKDRLNLRELPSTRADSLGKYDNGTSVEVLGVCGSWYHVRVGGKAGFMMAKYLTGLDGSSGSSGSGSGSGGTGSGTTAVVNNPNPKDRLNLRTKASTSGLSLARYYNGVSAKVLETDGDWVRVRIGTTEGYMMKKFLAFGSDGDKVKSAMPTLKVKNTKPTQRLNLRESPSTTSESLGKYKDGTKAQVLGVLDGWYHVKVDGTIGYMMAKFLQ